MSSVSKLSAKMSSMPVSAAPDHPSRFRQSPHPGDLPDTPITSKGSMPVSDFRGVVEFGSSESGAERVGGARMLQLVSRTPVAPMVAI
jgi:hypothetical protein